MPTANNHSAILMLHGWSSTPASLTPLAKFLTTQGFKIQAPVLIGHGTKPRDLIGVTWQRWLDQVQKEYLKLTKQFKKVNVLGYSLGGNLGLLLAARQLFDKLVLLSTPIKFRLHPLAKYTYKLLSQFNLNLTKKYLTYNPQEISVIHNNQNAYQIMPSKSFYEPFKIADESRKELPQIKIPTLAIYSKSDPIISLKSAYEIKNKLINPKNQVKIYESDYHLTANDPRFQKNIYQEVLNFLSN